MLVRLVPVLRGSMPRSTVAHLMHHPQQLLMQLLGMVHVFIACSRWMHGCFIHASNGSMHQLIPSSHEPSHEPSHVLMQHPNELMGNPMSHPMSHPMSPCWV